eukprot:91572-Rhodomonas_salina.5
MLGSDAAYGAVRDAVARGSYVVGGVGEGEEGRGAAADVGEGRGGGGAVSVVHASSWQQVRRPEPPCLLRAAVRSVRVGPRAWACSLVLWPVCCARCCAQCERGVRCSGC